MSLLIRDDFDFWLPQCSVTVTQDPGQSLYMSYPVCGQNRDKIGPMSNPMRVKWGVYVTNVRYSVRTLWPRREQCYIHVCGHKGP